MTRQERVEKAQKQARVNETLCNIYEMVERQMKNSCMELATNPDTGEVLEDENGEVLYHICPGTHWDGSSYVEEYDCFQMVLKAIDALIK